MKNPAFRASFKLLVKELQTFGLAVEAVTDNGEVIKFGKDEERSQTCKTQYRIVGVSDELSVP